jgi:hypothetical protein
MLSSTTTTPPPPPPPPHHNNNITIIIIIININKTTTKDKNGNLEKGTTVSSMQHKALSNFIFSFWVDLGLGKLP